jgi:hypothetical protein
MGELTHRCECPLEAVGGGWGPSHPLGACPDHYTKLYERGGRRVWLCSNCVFGDIHDVEQPDE